jgi:hypothetical protein
MKQKAYDNETFFEGYKQLRETGSGLNDALEQPAIRSLFPNRRVDPLFVENEVLVCVDCNGL